MKVQSIVKKNAYYDSVTLMLISRELKKMDGVEEVLVGMGTDMNLDLTRDLGMFTQDLETISSNDLFISAKFDETKVSFDDIEAGFVQQINHSAEDVSDEEYQAPTLSAAMRYMPGANMVLISIPGQSAAVEVEAALDAGLHVMLFSDNVPVEDELRL